MNVKKKMIETAVTTGAKMIGDVMLNAVDSFTKQGTDAVVRQVEKRSKTFVRIPSAAQTYYHRDYKEVKEELLAYGFTNVILVERKDLVTGLITKEGAIEEISIDGRADFKSKAKFHSDARVVIIYHTFKTKNK